MLSSELVADLNPDQLGGARIEHFAALGNLTYFFAERKDPAAAWALWKTDGTVAGTGQVKETSVAAGGTPIGLTAAIGRLLFTAYDPATGTEPWVSDGTPEGTHLLKDIDDRPPSDGHPYGSGAREFTEYNGRAYFAANTASGSELWVTEGTPESTQRFLDPMPGAGDADVEHLATGSGLLFFSARDEAGPGLWRSDGTAAGTWKLLPTRGSSVELTDVAGTTFFIANSQAGDPDLPELWKTDGTREGTVFLRRFQQGYYPYRLPYSLENVGGVLMFGAVTEIPYQGAPVLGLWRSDGTPDGTWPVLDRAPGSPLSLGPTHITAFGGGAVFFGYDSPAGHELWCTDGTTSGTHRILDIEPGGAGGINDEGGLLRAGARLFFVAHDSDTGAEWWTTDGTEAGTRRGVDLLPGTGSGIAPTDYTAVPAGVTSDGRVVFSGRAVPTHAEPWITDGTPVGTYRLANFDTAPAGSTFQSITIELGNGVMLFSANGKLYATRGDADSTIPLADVMFGEVGVGAMAGPSHAVVNGVAVFATKASPAANVTGVYRSDGTPEGTYLLRGVSALAFAFADASPFVALNGHVYFLGIAGGGGGLWRTDGTQGGTTLVKELAPTAFYPISVPAMGVAGGAVYFLAFNDQLWRSDGTADGTRMVIDLGAWNSNTSNRPFDIVNFTELNGRLLFRFYREDDPTRQTLWTSDGTAAGTGPVAKRVYVNGLMFPFGGAVYFGGYDFPFGAFGLYRSDGTAEGTVQLAFTGAELITSAAVLNNSLYLNGTSAVWKVDGTPGGTSELVVNQAGDRARIDSLTAWRGAVYFSADDGVHGRELWRTDGSAAGTALVEDLLPGPAGSDPVMIGTAGGRLVFAGADAATGTELRRLSSPPTTVVGRWLFYNHAAGSGAAAGDYDDSAIAADKSPLLPGQGPATIQQLSSFNRGINGLVIDVDGLPPLPEGQGISAGDLRFEAGAGPSGWAPAPAPLSVSVRTAAGQGGGDRIVAVWPDRAIVNTWLRVTVAANDRTGLSRPDVFYFGNLVGETGDSDTSFRVSSLDLSAVKRMINTGGPAAARFDINKDNRVNALDLAIVRQNLNHALAAIAGTAPALRIGSQPPAPAALRSPVPARLNVDSATMVRDETMADFLIEANVTIHSSSAPAAR